MSESIANVEVNVGVDVAKERLDIAVSEGTRVTCANDESGFAELVERLGRCNRNGLCWRLPEAMNRRWWRR
jgi:hypothetical protein